jgi:transposase
METLYLGIDIAKASFVAAALGPAGESTWGEFANTPAGFEQWRGQVAAALDEHPLATVLMVLEPTGGYELALAGFAAAQGWLVSRPNAGRVHDWAKSQGRRAESDGLDARTLAHYGAAQPLAAWKPLPRACSELESLLQRQEDVELMLQQERQRQAALALKIGTAPVVAASLASVLTSLETAQRDLQAALRAYLRAHPALTAKVRRQRTVPGIGPLPGLFVLVLLARWDTLTDGAGQAKGLVAYARLDPKTHDSGTSVHKPAHISRMGNRQLRRKLYLAAFGGVRARRGPLRDFYQRLVGRGKAKKLATPAHDAGAWVTAGARKILIWAWAIYRTETEFDHQRHAKPELQPA